jgi:hypothetical protein
MRILPRFGQPEARDADAQHHQQHPPRSPSRTQQQRDENVNPPHNAWKDNLSPEERAERDKAADRQWFKADGSMEAFYFIYPSERPPRAERKPEQLQSPASRPQQATIPTDEQARQVKDASRRYLHATGRDESFDPPEKSPGREQEPGHVPQRERGGREGRGGR